MAYRDEVLADSPVDYYEFETSTGTDSGSGARTLTKTGITTGVASKVGNAWSFNGTSDYASMASWPNPSPAFTFEAWVKAPSAQGMTSTYNTIIRRDGTDILILRVRSSSFGAGSSPGCLEGYVAGTTILSTTRVDDGNWHHVAMTVSGTTAKLYIDGVQAAATTTSKSTYNSGTGAAYVGAASGSSEFFKGTMDEVAVYNTALSATRIAAHYNAVASAYVDVSTVTASTAANDVDASGNATIGTVAPDADVSNDLATATTLTLTSQSTSNVPAVIQFKRTDISTSAITVSNATLWVKLSATGGLGNTVQAYRASTFSSGATKVGTATDTKLLDSYSPGAYVPFDVTATIQDAFTNNRVYAEIGLWRSAGTVNNTVFYSSESTGNEPYLTVTYTLAPVSVTVDLDTPTATTAANDVTLSTGTVMDVATVTVSTLANDATVDTSMTTDVATATASVTANDVTVETVVDPNVYVDVETAVATAQAADTSVTAVVTIDADTATASALAPDPTVETVFATVVDLDTPSIQTRVAPLTDVNGEPVLPTESEDNYFVSTARTVDTGDIWWRLDESSGTHVANRANPAAVWPATGTGTYDGVTIGQFNGPEGRRSVYFNGTARIEENEPTATNLDEVFYSPNTLEFTFRTERATEFIMGGADNSGFTVGSGISSPVEASEFWLVDGRINFRAYRLQSLSAVPQIVSNITGFKNLADGEWHHVVINAGISNPARGTRAIEIWVDGKLEIRRFAGVQGTSANETVETGVVWFGMPDFIGGRPDIIDGRRFPSLAVSQWFTGDMTEVVFRNNKVLSEDQILMQRDNMFGVIPVYVDTPRATIESHDASAKGNKPRVLIIDFQTSTYMQMNQTYDGVGPQPGRDVFGRVVAAPPYVAGYVFPTLTDSVGDNADLDAYQFFSAPVRNNYTDPVTDNERLLDLDVDINLDDYDVLAIGGYPANDSDWSWYDAMDAYSTPPFTTGRKQVENLINQVKEKVILGKRLFVNDPNSAVALGIVDRVEYVPTMRERAFNDALIGAAVGYYDYHAADINPWATNADPSASADRYRDEHGNNMQRVRKTIQGLTTIPSYIITDYFEWYSLDPMANPPAQSAMKVDNRPNGLFVGDEFYLNGNQGPGLLDWFDEYDGTPTVGSRSGGWIAAPMANVKVGSTVTSFGATVYNKTNVETNPYRDYAVSIAIEPGDTWDGQEVLGKAYINFTEAWTHWATFYENQPVQKVIDDPIHPQTSEQDEWDFSTYRGTWTGTTVNPNQASGGAEVQTNTSGAVEAGAGNKATKKPNQVSLVSFSWQSWPGWEIQTVPVRSMANRGILWLTSEIDEEGTTSVNLSTAQATVKADEATPETQRTETVDLATARVRTEAYADADTTEVDAAVLVDTAEATARAGAFREIVDLSTATLTALAYEPESDLLNGLEIIRLVLPRHAVTLYLEES